MSNRLRTCSLTWHVERPTERPSFDVWVFDGAFMLLEVKSFMAYQPRNHPFELALDALDEQITQLLLARHRLVSNPPEDYDYDCDREGEIYFELLPDDMDPERIYHAIAGVEEPGLVLDTRPRYVLLASFGGSIPVVVGIYDDWELMLDDVDNDGDFSDEEPERYEVARAADQNTIRCSEQYHRQLWDRTWEPHWKTKDGQRPKGWDDISEE